MSYKKRSSFWKKEKRMVRKESLETIHVKPERETRRVILIRNGARVVMGPFKTIEEYEACHTGVTKAVGSLRSTDANVRRAFVEGFMKTLQAIGGYENIKIPSERTGLFTWKP